MQKKKKQNRVACFDHIIELCHRRIRTVASYNGQNTFYEIPGIVVGYPLYNMTECIEYIVSSLRQNGFLVQILPPPHIGVVYISWDPRELQSKGGNAHAQKQLGSSTSSVSASSIASGRLPALPPSTSALVNMNAYNAHGDRKQLYAPTTTRPRPQKKSSPSQRARLF